MDRNKRNDVQNEQRNITVSQYHNNIIQQSSVRTFDVIDKDPMIQGLVQIVQIF